MSQPQPLFSNLLAQIMERLGIQDFDRQAICFRFTFAAEPALFLCQRDNGWAELQCNAAHLTALQAPQVALSLLELQGRQGGPLFVIACERDSGVVRVMYRFCLAGSQAHEVIDLIQGMRSFVSQVCAVVAQQPSPHSRSIAAEGSPESFRLNPLLRLQNR
ncbi:hypothetical protein WH50_03175 [Pokkaliibacter plantistimulans]|uniref:Type III secretion system chaperone n=1 Tax=Pokkaliibacter plantistimulans TaxID=1635171 RepID=A0ABX5M165_9GAMM|nr:type III secretion system chaperone [Pokkaliibacter plantistimulans]PXF32665.1 hypothetical protein WH50_03175 [Pokkaliibacter plantistimulans]